MKEFSFPTQHAGLILIILSDYTFLTEEVVIQPSKGVQDIL